MELARKTKKNFWFVFVVSNITFFFFALKIARNLMVSYDILVLVISIWFVFLWSMLLVFTLFGGLDRRKQKT